MIDTLRFFGGPADGREIEAKRIYRIDGLPFPPEKLCIPEWTGSEWVQAHYERSGDILLYVERTR